MKGLFSWRLNMIPAWNPNQQVEMDGNTETTIFQAKIWSYAITTSIFTNGSFSLQLLSQRFFDFPDLATAVREVDDQSKAAAL